MFVDPNADAQRVPDGIVALRQFVGALNGALNDQSYAGLDDSVYNPTGGFAAVGPYSTAVEGQPITLTSNGGLRLSSGTVLLLLGAAAAWVVLHHRKG